jgi:hypothetical protein
LSAALASRRLLVHDWGRVLAARPGYQVIYWVGWDLGAQERAAIVAISTGAWQFAVPAARSASAAPMTPGRDCMGGAKDGRRAQ